MAKSLIVAGAAGAAGLGPLDSISLYLFGVPISVIFMALCGAAISHTFHLDGDKPLSKKKVYLSITGNTVVASATISFLPEMLGWDWYSPRVEGSMALVFALASRMVIPLFFKTLPEAVRKWLRVGEYNTNKKASDENIQQ